MILDGYEWEHHKVKTSDGWHLTMFRITGLRSGKRPALDDEHKDKLPVLMQHGYGQRATTWADGGLFDPSLPMRLVDEGYDVWMGNNRGTKFSNVNDQDGTWSLKERWNFTWAEMGLYDMPAQIQKVIDITGKPKVTVIGYSQGSA